MDIDQSTAIVTGAASGLGEATAIMLAQMGAKVALWDINGALAQEVSSRINQTLGKPVSLVVPCDITNTDMDKRLKMLNSITPMSISVWSTGGDMQSAHWGEIMSTAARERGCLGAVVDGGVRDMDFILDMEFPVFARFKCPASSVGRWEIKDWQIPVKIGDTTINPGDYIFGDIDGVVVIPEELVLEVLIEAETLATRENGMRKELRQGMLVTEAYEKYGAL